MTYLFRNFCIKNTPAFATLICILWANGSLAAPQRIVSVSGALTEIIYALGAEEFLVGVDTTSSWPAAAHELPQVGYQRNLSAEGVLSLLPDMVLATADAGPPEVLTQLRNTGIEIKTFQRDYTVSGVINRVRGIAKIVNHEQRGEEIIRQILAEVNAAQLPQTSHQPKPRVLFLLSIGSGSPLASGSNTAADAMIQLAGGENVFASFEGYKPVATEAIAATKPDFLLLINHDKNSTANAEEALSLPGIKYALAGDERRVIHMNGLKLLGFGPRIGEAINELSNRLYSGQQE